ncbi:hypothetical protein WMF30_48645 [Sorangium sp. So ce134]
MTDRRPTGIPRIVICGAPRSGKKRLLTALAQYAGGPPPTTTEIADASAPLVSWEAPFPGCGVVRLEARHGPGFYYEADVAELFARPIAIVIYVLAEEPSGAVYEHSWRDFESRTFQIYLAAAVQRSKHWDNTPWLVVRSIMYGTPEHEARWMTDLLPAELMNSAITVHARSGAGVNTLAKAIQDAHRRVSAS